MRILAIAVVIAFLVAGCKEKHSSSAVQTNGDETVNRPDIEYESPVPDETGVLPTAVVLVRFSDPMDPFSINTGTFIVRDGSGAPIAGTITYNATTHEATFTPSALLMPSMTYTASLAAGILNTSGVSLGVGHAWLFTTAP
ncbi:MAG: Ig-like domain-containing protein [Planctomycetota bacterium]